MSRLDKVLGAFYLSLGFLALVQFIAPRAETAGPVIVNDPVTVNCMYPMRPLVNGACDNSDPCDPETLSVPGLWGDCELLTYDMPVLDYVPPAGGGK